MPLRIYNHFEIRRELSNETGNRKYQAYDTAANLDVLLCQWTPSLVDSISFSDTAERYNLKLSYPMNFFPNGPFSKPEAAKSHLEFVTRHHLFNRFLGNVFPQDTPSLTPIAEQETPTQKANPAQHQGRPRLSRRIRTQNR